MWNRRTRIWQLAALSLTVACNSPATAPETPQRPPRVVFRDSTLEFGTVEQGMPVRHVFPFRNDGSLALTIDNVRTSCGCRARLIAAPGAGRVITAGGEGAIEATCETARDWGRTTRTVTVYSNDPAQPVSTLTLRGLVRADVAADPPRLYVGHLARGQAASSDIRLIASDPAAVGISAVAGGASVITAGLREPAPGSVEKRVRIAIKPDAPFGQFTESVAIHTTSTRRPLLTVPVTGVVDGAAPPRGSGEKK